MTKERWLGIPLYTLNGELYENVLDIYRRIAGTSPTKPPTPPSVTYLKSKLVDVSPVVFQLGSFLEHGTGLMFRRQLLGVDPNLKLIRMELWPENGVTRYPVIEEWRSRFKVSTDELFTARSIAQAIDQFPV